MRMSKKYLLCILSGLASFANAQAQQFDPSLMTIRDMRDSALSNITITNRTAQPITVSGLFIASYDINDCSACFGSVIGGDNVAGTVAAPVTFKVNQSVPIGQNYLYNMLYNGLYFVRTNSSTPCNLPGCSWPSDTPNTKWCITINVVSLDSNYTYSNFTNGSNPPANQPPYGDAGTSVGLDYNYDLINPNTLGAGAACLGPITCNDKTLTCTVNTAQDESFQPYS